MAEILGFESIGIFEKEKMNVDASMFEVNQVGSVTVALEVNQVGSVTVALTVMDDVAGKLEFTGSGIEGFTRAGDAGIA